MKKIIFVLLLLSPGLINSINAQLFTKAAIGFPSVSFFSGSYLTGNFLFPLVSTKIHHPKSAEFDKRDKARQEILPLLRGIFNTHWNDLEVMLTVDAGWRNDSLSVEYKYYRGNNLLALNDNLLVEKNYFTVKPEEIDVLDTEIDEFQFLYLRNKRKKCNIHHLVTRPAAGITEEGWRSSFGFPVRKENLPTIIQLLKDLRKTE